MDSERRKMRNHPHQLLMSRTIKRSLVVLLGLILVMSVFCLGRADAATKGIKSVTNVNAGIQVRWNKESGQSGYHIYRQVLGSGSWKLVETVNGASTLKWIDKGTVNGKTYRYKVISFKGYKENTNTKVKTICRLKTPKITSLKAVSSIRFRVKTNRNIKVTGYQIRYSSSSKFTNAKVVSRKATALNTKIKGLKKNKKHYVRVRAYKVTNGKKYYSNWSAMKSVKLSASKTVYTSHVWTTLYEKQSSSSSSVKVWYNTKLEVLGETSYASGTWTKVKYSGKTYYVWTAAGESKLKTTAPKTSYTSSEYNDFQNKVIEKAFYILNNWDTKYDHSHRTEDGVAESDGRYAFDCSGFSSYVINSVMQETCPAFELSPATTERTEAVGQLDQDVIVNEGLKGEIRLETIADNRKMPDLSKLKAGDLIFFDNDEGDVEVDHVGIYIGNGEFIQSTKIYMEDPDDMIDGKPAGGVCIAPLKDLYEEDFVAVRRITPQTVKSADVKMVTTKGVTIYGDSKCKTGESEEIARLGAGTPVTLMFTMMKGSHLNAYVSYEGGEGFVFEYQDRLSEE